MAMLPALFGLFLAAFVTGQTVDITPLNAVRRVGDELTVLCKVDYPIDSCRMTVGGNSYILRPNEQNENVVYAGQGLSVGECGARIRNIEESYNGDIMCNLPPRSGSKELTATMRLQVAKAPGHPELVTPAESSFKEGDSFMAQCIVPNGRPAAKITWFLGSEELLTGVHQPVVTSEPGSDLQTIRQNVSRQLVVEDDNKMLVCRAEHEALDQPLEAKRQLIVQYPPKRLESGTLTIFGLKLGAEGRLNVTIRANPLPIAEWTVGDQRLVAPQNSDTGAYTALQPLLLGNGYYNITLIVRQIVKDDVDRTYYLRVSNNLGREEFALRISTMDEPAGVELDTGAIVGIVLAVLILLIAISLIVFAFATDRWCFAGRSHRTDIPDGVDSEAPLPPHDDIKGSENPSHDHGDYISNGRRRDATKSSGESTPADDVLLESANTLPRTSDTESAVGGRERSRLANLGARMRAVLPRAKDKVQATESQAAETEDKSLSEEKKGVVYAELVLGDQTTADKPPPPATEYAEIVYTDKPKDKTEN